MRHSIREISKLTGFSPATVSNALNNKKGVNAETAKQIFKTAKEIGYLTANRITSIKFVVYKRDGVVVSDTPFFSILMESVENACREAGYDTIIYNINKNKADYQARLQELLNNNTSGILLLATEMKASDLKVFEKAISPIVVLDAWFENMNFDTVMTNNEDSVKKGVRYLIKNGHTKIGYLAGNIRIQNFIHRGRGLYRTLQENHLEMNPEHKVLLTPTLDGAYNDMCEYLGTAPALPTAYFADNDIIALGAIKALKQFGYHIPKDISIIGFDDLPYCEVSTPALTTIKFFQEEMGRLSVYRLVEKIKNSNLKNAKLQISTQFIKRESVQNINI